MIFLSLSFFIDDTVRMYYNEAEVNMNSLWGKVKFLTDGIVHEPALCAGRSGEIPEPTVKSGWEKTNSIGTRFRRGCWCILLGGLHAAASIRVS